MGFILDHAMNILAKLPFKWFSSFQEDYLEHFICRNLCQTVPWCGDHFVVLYKVDIFCCKQKKIVITLTLDELGLE
jgi:hypothetical protein